MQIIHYSVMKHEVLTHLVPLRNEGVLVDCTLGEGGHSEAFLSMYPDISVIGVDRDAEMIRRASERLGEYHDRFTAVNSWFDDFLCDYPTGYPVVQGILLDLGISTYHYEAAHRGFSFNEEEALDMRLDKLQELTASGIIHTYPESRLADLIYQYGEERYSRRIARSICEARREGPVESARQLRDIVYHCVPQGYRRGRIHPATKTFQALRIEVNSELSRVKRGVEAGISLLCDGGRIGVISFHSLEDRLVKHLFRLYAGRAPGDNKETEGYRETPVVKLVTRKPITPGDEEVRENPASRSAKLRVAEKLGGIT